MTTARRPLDERGQTSVLIIGFAAVLFLAVALVVNASATFIQRQGLDSLADGAALAGADAGAQGEDVYQGGLGDERLDLVTQRALAGVAAYLASADAGARYPGLSYTAQVAADGTTITVSVNAPVDLPFTVPGSPSRPTVGATGSAIVLVDAG